MSKRVGPFSSLAPQFHRIGQRTRINKKKQKYFGNGFNWKTAGNSGGHNA